MGYVWYEPFAMSKRASLTVKGIESRRKKGLNKLYSDAGARGLYLKTTSAGSASWIFRWRDRTTGKLRDMGLGTVDEVSLQEARDAASDNRQLVRKGGDPITDRRRERYQQIAEYKKAQTFKQCAEAFYTAIVEPAGHTEKHKQRWKSMMTIHVYPKIGDVLIGDIELVHVESVLRPIWTEHLDTARKVRQAMEKVLSWAITGHLRSAPNPAVWRGNLDTRLADTHAIRKAKPINHHKAHPWRDMHNLMVDLRKRDGLAARATEFCILTAARPGMVRGATWDEIDSSESLWHVPAARMKNGKGHIVPLSAPAMRLLKNLPRNSESPYVFWAPRGGPLSDMAMAKVLKRLGTDVTVHGTARSSFKDWAREQPYPDEWSELALSHVNSDATRSAYARDALIGPRTRLMRDWAKFLNTAPNTDNNVTPIKAAHS